MFRNENIKNSNAQDKEGLILWIERGVRVKTEKAKVKFDDLIGLEKAKSDLRSSLIFPYLILQKTQRAQSYGAKGILLYGPSGCGKTSLIQACAYEMNAKFYIAQVKDFFQDIRSTQKFIKELFRTAIENHPACIVLEDVDYLCPSYPNNILNENEDVRRTMTEFLVQMMSKFVFFPGSTPLPDAYAAPQIFIIGTTQAPWKLSPAMRRRFEKRIHVFPPDQSTRESLLTERILQTENSLKEPQDISVLSELTEGFSYQNIVDLVRLAAYEPVRELQRAKHFKTSEDQRSEACSSDDPEAKEMSLLHIPYENIKPRKITMEDFQKVIHKISSNTIDTMNQHQQFSVDFDEGCKKGNSKTRDDFLLSKIKKQRAVRSYSYS